MSRYKICMDTSRMDIGQVFWTLTNAACETKTVFLFLFQNLVVEIYTYMHANTRIKCISVR